MFTDGGKNNEFVLTKLRKDNGICVDCEEKRVDCEEKH